MKLYTTDNAELMDVATLRAEGRNLIVEGTIMGAMPVCAVLTPAELRSGLKLVGFKTVFSIIGMLFK